MKKKIVLLLTLLASMTFAYADGIVSITNVNNAYAGYTGSFDIVLNESNTESFRAYQFDLQLPEGLSYSSNSNGELLTTHQTTVSDELADRTWTISGYANPNAAFTSTTGTLMTIYFTVSSGISGDKAIQLKNIKFTTNDNTTSTTDNTEKVISVGSTVILSEDETTVPVAANGVDVTVQRELKAGVWNTIVLPFDVPATQIETVFGTGTKIGYFTGYTVDITNSAVSVNFESRDAIVANTPYIIKVPTALTEFTISNTSIVASEDLTVDYNTGGGTRIKYSEFTGSYVPTIIEDYFLFLSDNSFVYSKGKSKIKGFRAYFNLSDAYYAAARMRISFNEATGINDVKASDDGDKVYNLSGQRVATPKNGLYIKNGKKVIIKK